ncbi:MAG: MarR family transcriptional regulator [Caulobacter sp.]|nr:MarR family transcriptional regulator [Caulobacter sp.]
MSATPPLPTPDEALKLSNQLCFPIYAAANAIQKAYRPHLKPLGLTYPQYLVMLVLWEADGVSLGDIGRRLHLDSGTLTPLLKRLEAAGLVARRRSDEDERVVLISLTAKGRALKADAAPIPFRLAADLHMEPEQALALKQGLEALFQGTASGADR